jgi:hypothetical protein
MSERAAKRHLVGVGPDGSPVRAGLTTKETSSLEMMMTRLLHVALFAAAVTLLPTPAPAVEVRQSPDASYVTPEPGPQNVWYYARYYDARAKRNKLIGPFDTSAMAEEWVRRLRQSGHPEADVIHERK